MQAAQCNQIRVSSGLLPATAAAVAWMVKISRDDLDDHAVGGQGTVVGRILLMLSCKVIMSYYKLRLINDRHTIHIKPMIITAAFINNYLYLSTAGKIRAMGVVHYDGKGSVILLENWKKLADIIKSNVTRRF